MKREFTNLIRFVMDECLPPIIRDRKWFMYPFYHFAYRGNGIREKMELKDRILSFDNADYARFYAGLRSISRDRETDLNRACVEAIIGTIKDTDRSLLDLGCGNGFLLWRVCQERPGLKLAGVDVKPPAARDGFEFVEANIEALPFPDRSFDVITMNHVLEHLLNPEAVLREIRRVARRAFIIVTPRQRYYYHTLDEHINFFPHEWALKRLFPNDTVSIRNLDGDWIVIGHQHTGAGKDFK